MPLANRAPPVHEAFGHIGFEDFLQRFLERALEQFPFCLPRASVAAENGLTLCGAVTVIRPLGQVGFDNQPVPWPPPGCKQYLHTRLYTTTARMASGGAHTCVGLERSPCQPELAWTSQL